MQAGDIEIYDPGLDRWWPLALAEPAPSKDDPTPSRMILEGLFSAESDSSIAKRLQPQVQEDWSLGIGVSYDWAPGLYTRTPGYVCPAGAATVVSVPHPTYGQIVGFEEFGGDLFAIQVGETTGSPVGGRVLRSVGGGDTWTESLVLSNVEYMRGLLAADNGSGEARLYAFSSDGGVNNGRVHEWDGSTWTSTTLESSPGAGDGTFGEWGRADAKTVFWTTSDGIGAHRIVCISGERTVSYTRPNADPMLASSWVEGVRISGARGILRKIAAARTHVYVSAEDGLYDLDELGNSPNLMNYVGDTVQFGNGLAVQYHDGAVFYSLATGLDRVLVEQNGLLQELPGMCGPNWGTRGENPVVGSCSALTTDQGYLVAAIFNQATRESFVCWGKSAKSMGIESRNPMLWWGPEVHFSAAATEGGGTDGILAMTVSNLVYGKRYLWMASVVAGSPGTRQAHLSRVSLPLAGAPLQDVFSRAGHQFATGTGSGVVNPFCRLYQLPNTWDDKPSLKILHQHAVGSRGLDAADGTRLVEYDRADPSPGSTDWGTGIEITASPSQTITATTPVKGYEIGRRIDFFSPQGTAATPKVAVLNSLRTTAWKVAPSFTVWTLAVAYGAGVLDMTNGRASGGGTFDPDYLTERLKAIIAYGPTTLRDRRGRRKTAKLEQVMNVESTFHDEPPGKTVKIAMEISIIGDAA